MPPRAHHDTPFRPAAGFLLAVLALAGLLAACQAPVPDSGDQAFALMAERDKAAFQPNGYLVLTVPGRRDYLALGQSFAGPDDVLLGLDLDDFMQAGLDPAKIDPGAFQPGVPVYDLPTSTLLISYDLGNPAFNFAQYKDKDGKVLPAPASRTLAAEIIRTLPALLTRDSAAGLFQLNFGASAALAWPALPKQGQAQADGQADMALILDPAPLVRAGLDPSRLQVWKTAKAPGAAAASGAGERLVLACRLH